MSSFNIKKISDIFGIEIPRSTLIKAEDNGNIPSAKREQSGSVQRRAWTIDQLPEIGEKYGFLKKPTTPAVISVFTTKGGVLKSTLSLNLARMAALHNIKTCIIGLDLQGDITASLGFENGIDEDSSLEEANDILSNIYGLYDYERGDVSLESLIHKSDIPTLDFIPETPELHLLDKMIGTKNRREFWIKDFVTKPLLKNYDLLIFDCSPNWNNLVTNAIASCDLLVSPLECKINNYRNYPAFKFFVEAFKNETQLSFAHLYVPTRLSPTRKLSKEIRNWYLKNTPNCISSAIKESIKGEEAMAKFISLPEHAPTSLDAQEMRQVIMEIWDALQQRVKNKTDVSSSLHSTSKDIEAQL